MNPLMKSVASFALLVACTTASAHTVWLRQDMAQPSQFRVEFGGHAGAIDPYPADKVKDVSAVDADGKPLAVAKSGSDNAVRLSVDGTPVMVLVHFDNGIHTKTGSGPSVPKPMDEVPGAISAVNAVKYHKTIVAWGSPTVTKPVGQAFEVIPVSAAAPIAGQPMQVQVRIDGKPAAGIKLGRGEDTNDAVTDANGIASYTPTAGFNKIWAGKRTPAPGNPKYSELSIEYALGFELP